MTYIWDYHPGMDTYFLMGPWVAPDGRKDMKYKYDREYAHIRTAAGGVYWAYSDSMEPIKFFDLEEAKAFVLASVALS